MRLLHVWSSTGRPRLGSAAATISTIDRAASAGAASVDRSASGSAARAAACPCRRDRLTHLHPVGRELGVPDQAHV